MTTTDFIARGGDPAPSHEKMAEMRHQAVGREAQTIAALRSLELGGGEWVTARQITDRTNSMTGDDRQERDVSRTLTTLWREGRVVRLKIAPHGNGRTLLHFRSPRPGEEVVAPVRRGRPKPGDRTLNGGEWGTIITCPMCDGDGLLHEPDNVPEPVEPWSPDLGSQLDIFGELS
jgi:hypothetical protein